MWTGRPRAKVASSPVAPRCNRYLVFHPYRSPVVPHCPTDITNSVTPRPRDGNERRAEKYAEVTHGYELAG
jgi:hypothetical protein